MSCPICKKTATIYIENNFKIYRCGNCGFGFTEGTEIQKGDYHRDETYDLEESLFRNIFLKRVNIINKFIKQGSVLEIGCSTGIMLQLFKDRGFSVTGIELSKPAAKVAENRGIFVINKPFEKINFKNKFDLIVLNHTLEHLDKPKEILKRCKTLLKPKGLIYIDLPNFDALSLKFQKQKWPLLLPKEHLWHFTEKSFKVIFSELDFKILYVEKASGIWDFAKPFNELVTALLNRKKRFFNEFFTSIPTFILTKKKIGTDLMIVARKK